MRIPYADCRAEIIFCGSGNSNFNKQFFILYYIISRQIDGRVLKTLYAGELTDLYRVSEKSITGKPQERSFVITTLALRYPPLSSLLLWQPAMRTPASTTQIRKDFIPFFGVDSRCWGYVAHGPSQGLNKKTDYPPSE
jgi:hypothetical protein